MARAAAGAVIASVSWGQARPTFEVASVKPSDPTAQGRRAGLQGGPGTDDPGRITASRITLQALMRDAYGVNFDQIQGPDWISEERYDLTAKVPLGTTKDQMKLMLQSLIEERFHMALHHIQKESQVYELTIAKGGSKLKENTDQLEPSRLGDGTTVDRNGFPQIPPGKSGMKSNFVNELNHMTAQGVPLSTLTFLMGAQLGSVTGANTYAPGRIVDKTGLTGKYDFHLEYSGSAAIGAGLSIPSEPLPGPTLIEAVEKQLGLKLVKSTTQLDVVVIDHAEKTPAAN